MGHCFNIIFSLSLFPFLFHSINCNRITAQAGHRTQASVHVGRPFFEFQLGGAQRVVDVASVDGCDDGRFGCVASIGFAFQSIGPAIAVERGRQSRPPDTDLFTLSITFSVDGSVGRHVCLVVGSGRGQRIVGFDRCQRDGHARRSPTFPVFFFVDIIIFAVHFSGDSGDDAIRFRAGRVRRRVQGCDGGRFDRPSPPPRESRLETTWRPNFTH